MRQPIFKTAIAMGIILFSFPAFAQKADAKGCKDHPIFERIEKYFISDCNGNADEYVIMMGENKPKPMEGNVTEITYRYDAEAGAIEAKHSILLSRGLQEITRCKMNSIPIGLS